jgi:hypothetical protein
MLTYLEPQEPKNGKKWDVHKTPYNAWFFRRTGWSAAGAAAPLSYGEEKIAVRQCHGQGAPGRIFVILYIIGRILEEINVIDILNNNIDIFYINIIYIII